MSEESIDGMRKTLAAYGFIGDDIDKALRENLLLGLRRFVVPYRKEFIDGIVHYELEIDKAGIYGQYRLAGAFATLRKPVRIEHLAINGIDPQLLDEKMERYNWHTYFNKGITEPEQVATYLDIIKELDKLRSNLPDGREIMEKLMFKHWPKHQLEAEMVDKFRQQYETNGEFETGYNFSANLIYQTLSGKLGDLHQKLSYLGLDELSGNNLWQMLSGSLKSDPEEFTLNLSCNRPEGHAEFSVPIKKMDGWYAIDIYRLVLTPYPAIKHGYYNGFDTLQLEGSMKGLDWHNTQELYPEDEYGGLNPIGRVTEIQEQLAALGKHPNGAEIACLLQLKYWQNVPMFEDFIEDPALEMLEKLPKRSTEFRVETGAAAAINLLHGRAVMEEVCNPFDPVPGAWIRMEIDLPDVDGGYHEAVIYEFTKTELEKLLHDLPITDYRPVMVENLSNGDLVRATMNDGRRVVLEANPEEKTLNVYTDGMRLIPLNLKFDPDWRPAGNEQQISLQTSKQHKEPKIKYQFKKRR